MITTNMMEKPLDGAGLLTVNEIINRRLSGKQDKISGLPGQIVGINDAGEAAARDGVTMQDVYDAINAAITGAIEGAY